MELLVSVAIVIVLAGLVAAGANRFLESGRKAKTMSQFRDFQVGMALFEVDYMKPPIPRSKRDTGWDTIYGDKGGFYSNQFLVAALAGEDKDFPYIGGQNFATRDVNPRNESYIVFPHAPDKRGGVGDDGKLYDPWGREIMVAINGLKSTNNADMLVDFNKNEPGRNDQRLHTWGLAEYKDTKPKDEAYVFWSYGKDGKKGKNGPSANAIVPFAGSDDVISW
jgi:type II secretory pathway pseudopilin PulG